MTNVVNLQEYRRQKEEKELQDLQCRLKKMMKDITIYPEPFHLNMDEIKMDWLYSPLSFYNFSTDPVYSSGSYYYHSDDELGLRDGEKDGP